jgi:ubiquinone/menaquinone biosynthesis C-methylase UbiE
MGKETDVCSHNHAWSLDNFFRKWVHNPNKMFGKYIREGMTILDIGCGPGAFLEAFAEKTGSGGKVIEADLQEEMLEIVSNKIKKNNLEDRVILHKCGKDSIGIDSKADFVNAFYMVHEVPDSKKLIKEIYSILAEGGIFFLTEPKVHVSNEKFNNTIKLALDTGFKLVDRPSIFISRTAVFVKN